MLATTRTARQTLRRRAATTRLRASLNRGRAIATHVIAAGVETDAVAGITNGLRSVAKRLHVEPVKVTRTHRTVQGHGRMRRVGHYTTAQLVRLAAAYRPRKAELITALTVLTGFLAAA
ncbi:hypothetical protein [Streptacidiphilus cavernicola]|uniref:Uncharacterized protein n=1 Tax=Streptacidiphilus cavernicola TaxID=3342716 RepID=A0ABV6W476_9ACTN